AMLIGRGEEIDIGRLGNLRTLGITAGASAPEVLIDEVIDTLRRLFDVTIETTVIRDEKVAFKLPRELRRTGENQTRRSA
ncbi:MAG: hypothetical protein ACREDW_07290, partial [Aestuariivirgaceae bacterium]